MVSGTIQIQAEASDANLATIEILVDGQTLGTSSTSPFSLPFDTALRLDGSMTVEVIVTDLAGNQTSCTAQVTVDNISYDLDPDTLNLKSKGKANSVTANLEGFPLVLMLPTSAHTIELRVPAGNPVFATPGFGVLNDLDSDNIPDTVLKFDRQELIASIKAGIAVEQIQPDSSVEIQLVADGFVIGTATIRIKGG